MKKKILSVILALGILTSGGAAFADGAPAVAAGAISPEAVRVMWQEKAQYITIAGKITETGGFLHIQGEEAQFDLVITDDTLIYNNQGRKMTKEDLKKDTAVIAFENINNPAPMVEPPRYTPEVVIIDTGDAGGVTVDTFRTAEDTGRLTSQGNMLALNLQDDANIVDEDGEKFEGELEGRDLVVFSKASTMSIPAQTNPELIIVLDQKETEGENDGEEEMPVGFANQTGIVTEIGDMIHVKEGENEFDVVLTDDTLIYNQKGEKLTKETIQKDTKISVFADGNKPMLLVYPPRYTPEVVVVIDEEDFTSVAVDRFVKMEDDSYLSSGRTLVMHHNAEVKTVDENGEAFTGELEGRALAVFYTAATKSLPPQTTPELVIVLDEEKQAEIGAVDFDTIYHRVVVNGKEIQVDTDDATVTGMVPVRAAAEALNLEVRWDDVVDAVAIGTVPMGVNFNVGINQYNKSRMTPFTLSKAPVQITLDDENYAVTFVPADFFSEILEAEVKAEGETLYINLAE